ncbi:hypothetical protein EG327_004208 [Venturia inaequalis]|uniref:Uncharacterized protein n=1 Tax=Venturia inaequalis TaxID=5025 RepID=A0A8H3VGS3_VENIN|nr:hypothetical protein EG327_004208 [Venturia inaequalis]
MYGSKQLLVLALAVSALACQCKTDGSENGQFDINVTQYACIAAGGGAVPLGPGNLKPVGYHD